MEDNSENQDNQNMADMENISEKPVEESVKSNKNKVPMVIIVLALVVGGYFLYSNMNSQNSSKQNISETGKMMENTLPEESTVKNQDVMVGKDEDTMMEDEGMEASIINVEGGSFYFKPNEIRVKKGEKVTIILSAVDGLHDFVIDEFNASTEKIRSGETSEISFTPDKIGEYEFYCSVGDHRAQGMVGTLVVEE
ncbi:cupredoxin domain-containing protein [Patescibacteria group bacterium]